MFCRPDQAERVPACIPGILLTEHYRAVGDITHFRLTASRRRRRNLTTTPPRLAVKRVNQQSIDGSFAGKTELPQDQFHIGNFCRSCLRATVRPPDAKSPTFFARARQQKTLGPAKNRASEFQIVWGRLLDFRPRLYEAFPVEITGTRIEGFVRFCAINHEHSPLLIIRWISVLIQIVSPTHLL